MADTIDVDKLKNDAFDAIDALFGEEEGEELSPATEKQEATPVVPPVPEDEPEEIPEPEPVQEFEPEQIEEPETVLDESEDQASSKDFEMLEEFSLALDWEYSEKEISRFLDYLDSIGLKYTDKYNQALVKMLKSIVSYLQKAKNKAFPQTLSVMTDVITSLKQINLPDFDQSQLKDEVGSAYQKVVILKQKIAEYNEELKKHALKKEEEQPPEQEPAVEEIFQQKSEPEEEVETIYSYDLIEDETGTDDAEPEMFEAPASTESELSFPPEAPQEGDFTEDLPASPSIQTGDPSMLSRLEQVEQRLAYLENQNKQLKRLLINQQQGGASLVDGLESGISDEPAAAFDMNAFSPEEDHLSPIDEPVTVNVDEISYDENGMDPFESSEDDVFEAGDGGYEEDLALPLDQVDETMPLSGPKEDFIEYVRFFKLDQQIIAIPNDSINNVYKIPSGLKKTINSLDSVPLKNFSSTFQKLSKNMKGALQDVPNNELQDITADVKLVGQEVAKLNHAVLCSDGNHHVIIPVSDKHKTKLMLAMGMEKTDNGYTDQTIEIEDVGRVPLVNPF